MKISTFSRGYIRKRTGEMMTDTCIITRPGDGGVTYDPVTHQAHNAPAPEVYRGPCRLWEIPAGSQTILGDQEYVLTQSWLSLPFDAPVPEPEDMVEITGSDDVSLIHRSVKILSIMRGGGLRASRRMSVQVIDSKKVEW